MIEPPKVAARPELHARSRGPAVAVVLICASIALLLSFDAVYARLQWALSAAEPSIAAHPRLGAIAFVLFAALSAILAFFSSALLLPAAVFTWGTTVTLGLLWLGWLLGGLVTSALGRELRRPRGMVSKTPNKLDLYLQTTPGEVTFTRVLLLCLALPSEIPGYLCGYLGVRIRTYVPALAMAELPYAIGAVALGDGVAHRHIRAARRRQVGVGVLGDGHSGWQHSGPCFDSVLLVVRVAGGCSKRVGEVRPNYARPYRERIGERTFQSTPTGVAGVYVDGVRLRP